MTRFAKLSIVAVLFCYSGIMQAETTPKQIVMAASGDPLLNRVAQAVGDRAFGKFDIKFVLKDFPKARALANANSGIADGDAYRVLDFHKKTEGRYPNLTLINAPYISISWTAFVNKSLKDTPINDWEDMKNYRVTGIRGNKTMEYRLKEHLPKENRFIVENYSQAFAMLEKNRVDIVIAKPSVGIAFRKKNPNLRPVGRFEVHDLYMYLHKKHQHLIPGIESEIRAMEKDGTLSKIEQEVRSRFK